MRLFYAVTFSEDVRRRLSGIQEALRAQTVRGSFTLFENLHLTLVFVGEVAPARVAPLFKIAKDFRLAPFELRISGVGRFKRDGGSIVWSGIVDGGVLNRVYEQLAGQVAAAGFRVEDREYTPHLTLARQVQFRDSFDLRAFSDAVPPIEATVGKISLMQSERLGGRLVYTEVG